MILETERLYLRKLTDDDFDNLCKILQDSEVMYAYEHAFSDEEVREWLARQQKRYESDGFGLWGVVLKESGEMIGQCGLTLQDYKDRKVVEVGYLFQKKYWNNGYAIESAKACRDYAFDILGIDEVYSIIRDNNLSSQKVAIKNGMEKRDIIVKHYYNMDMPHFIFSVRKNDLVKYI